MKLQSVRYFVTLAQTLNFTRTAEIHYISQTAISQQIKLLEDELHVKLFSRNSHQVKLTPAGNAFYGYALKILNLVDMAEEHVKNVEEQETSLDITFLPGTEGALTEYFGNYKEQYPNSALHFHRAESEQALLKVKHMDTDVAFTLEMYPVQDPALSKTPVKSFQMFVVTSNKSRFAQFTSLHRSQLKDELLISQIASKKEWASITKDFNEAGTDPKHVLFVDSIESMLLELSYNNGYAILSEPVLDTIPQSLNLASIPLENEKIPLYAYWNTNNTNIALERFLSLLSSSGGLL